eukprot:6490890-Amphidinium_carterae.1
MEKLGETIEQWEREVRDYARVCKKALDEEIKIGVLAYLAPDKAASAARQAWDIPAELAANEETEELLAFEEDAPAGEEGLESSRGALQLRVKPLSRKCGPRGHRTRRESAQNKAAQAEPQQRAAQEEPQQQEAVQEQPQQQAAQEEQPHTAQEELQQQAAQEEPPQRAQELRAMSAKRVPTEEADAEDGRTTAEEAARSMAETTCPSTRACSLKSRKLRGRDQT